jgi:nitrile hydratase subunit beta
VNGIHDMGGMDGFGAVAREANEPVFHEDWERRLVGLNLGLVATGFNVDEFRHAIERIPPARYLASSYYERWLLALETLLVEHGLIGRDEFAARLGVDPKVVAVAAPAARVGGIAGVDRTRNRARFRAGERVRARNLNPAGHTRTPRYVHGRLGVVRRDWGVFTLPDTNAHHAGKHLQHVYSVEFTARELWGKPAGAREHVLIDLWEDYLEPVGSKPRWKRSAGKGRR